VKKTIILICILAIYGFVQNSKNNKYKFIFEESWKIVNERFYDYKFGGIDWKKTKDKYKHIQHSKTDKEFCYKLNKMLFELNSSHLGIGAISSLKNNISPYMFASGSIGIDVRILNNEIIISKVNPELSAYKLGLRTGFIIKTINGLNIADFIKQTTFRPPFNLINYKFHLTSTIIRNIYGKAGTHVLIKYSDHNGLTRSIKIKRIKRSNNIILSENMPPVFIEIESKILKENIGYLRFNGFQPPIPSKINTAITDLMSTKGLIIDLRGNDGGSTDAMKFILNKFVSQSVKYCTWVGRRGKRDDYLIPMQSSYDGKVIVLVDEMSISAAEHFALSLQKLGIAKIVGTQTPGQLLAGQGFFIQENVLLVVPIEKIVYPDGFNPEGKGVTPDFKIKLNKNLLIKGIDNQLDKAFNILRQLK